jgi:cytochrome c553
MRFPEESHSMKMSITVRNSAREAVTIILAVVVLAAGCLPGAVAEVAASEDGATLYATCAACHGKDGGGLRDGTVPAIGGQPAAVVLKALEDFRAGRRRDLRMQHFTDAEHLSGTAALQAIAAYVAGLKRTTRVAQGAGTALEIGKREFARACSACHGAGGTAVAARGIPALAGQHASYLERKLREAMLPGNTLARSHGAIVSRLAEGQGAAIADWLSRQPGP